MATDSMPQAWSHFVIRMSSGVVAPKSATSRLMPPATGAHTQCRSLPRSMPATLRKTTGKPSICFFFLVLLLFSSGIGSLHLSEHDRPGWPHAESDLGECYESLANVQLPSRNHALQAAYARMQSQGIQ